MVEIDYEGSPETPAPMMMTDDREGDSMNEMREIEAERESLFLYRSFRKGCRKSGSRFI